MSRLSKILNYNSKDKNPAQQVKSFPFGKAKRIKKKRFIVKKGLNKSQLGPKSQKVKKFYQESANEEFLSTFFYKRLPLFFPSTDELFQSLRILEQLFKQQVTPLQQLLSLKQKSMMWDQKCDQTDILEYYSLLKIIDQPRCQTFTLTTDNDQFISKVKLQGLKTNKKFSLLRISQLQLLIIQNRDSFMEKIDIQEQKSISVIQQLQKMGSLSKQILFLYNIYLKVQRSLQKMPSFIENIHQKLSEEKKISEYYETPFLDIYHEYLAIKNLKIGVQDSDLNGFSELNFFKRALFVQQRKYGNYIPIQNNHGLKSFLAKRQQRKKLNSGKVCNNLPTACECCFSSYYELYNPISKCNQCFKRTHKFCSKTREQCEFCLLKATKPHKQCIVCPAKNLMVKAIHISNAKNKSFVHYFCMLFHKFYVVSQTGSIQFNEDLFDCLKVSQDKCFICGLLLNAFIQCKQCNRKMHATCAYFSGFQFRMEITKDRWKQKRSTKGEHSLRSYDFIILTDCCSLQEQEKIEEKSYQRKYKLNINNFVYQNIKKGGKATSNSIHSIQDKKQSSCSQLLGILQIHQNNQHEQIQEKSNKSIQQHMSQYLFQQEGFQ